MMQLRPYQDEALDATYAYWQGGGGNGLLVLPTGAGKSLVIATLCKELLAKYPGLRIGIVTHVKELVGQNLQELIRVWPGAPAGIYSAGIGRRDTHSRILFMGIQSVHNKVQLLGKFDLLLVDEAHLIPRSSDTMYGKFIGRCRAVVPDMRLLGLTATPYRLDSGRLDGGKDALFDGIIYEANVRDLIEAGYLSKLISRAAVSEADISGVHVRGGEFIPAELEAAVNIPTVVEAAVDELCAYGMDRKGWLAFCAGVDHASQVRDEIRKHGISCETITGATPNGERDSIIRAYKAQKIRCLTSVGVLTTGFNAPHVDLIGLMRPTLSTGLYVQMVGRGFRLAPGKDDCLVLDYAGNVRRHGPIDAVKPQRSGDKGQQATEEKTKAGTVMAKVCPNCRVIVALNVMTCADCQYEWPPAPVRHEARAEDVSILSNETKVQAIPLAWHPVSKTNFYRHEKEGSKPTVRVEHLCGYTVQKEWWCFEHYGFAREKSVEVWHRLGGSTPAPTSTDEALERIEAGELFKIAEIRLKPREGSKFTEIAGHRRGDERMDAVKPYAYDELEDIPF